MGSKTPDHAVRSMRVHRLECPVWAVHSHGSGDVGAIRTIVLELETESGLVGWGEASPWPVFTGTPEANVAALHRYFRPFVVGADPLHPAPILARAEADVVHCTEARAALETALADIAGKVLGVPVSVLLGGAHRREIPLSFSVANPDFEEDVRTVARLHEDGVRIFKVKTGFAGHAFDVERLERLRGEYGNGIRLRVDYNQGLAAWDAVRRLRDLESFDLCFIEQPVPRRELEAMAAIAQALATPVMADESVFDAHEALTAARLRIADVFALKIMKSGGIRRALEVAAIARAAGIAVYGGCMFETGIAHAAGAHLMAATPALELGCEFYMPTYYLREDILREPFPVRDGMVIVPDRPGLGVEVDRDKLSRYTVESFA